MLAVSKILTGAAGLALVAGAASPAAAQYGYGYGYPGSGGNTVGQVINQVLGGGAYGQYGTGSSSVAVDQCARAAIARVSGSGYGGYGAYNQGYNNRGYGYNGYNNAGAARVIAITRVEQRSNGLRVRGVIDAGYGAYGNQGYGYGNYGYGNRGAGQQLDFKCTVDYRGYVRDIDLNRRSSYYRGY